MLETLIGSWFYVVVAAIGGILGHLMRKFSRGQPVSLAETLLQGVSAAFAGYLVLLACRASGAPTEVSGVLTGLCGWLGADASLMVLQTYIYRRLNLHSEQADHADQSR